jgi:hypothetical protein
LKLGEILAFYLLEPECELWITLTHVRHNQPQQKQSREHIYDVDV